MFTDGHAEMTISDYFDDLKDLDKIDWNIMEKRQWADTIADGDRKRRRQAEFLVHGFFPWKLVAEIGVISNPVAKQVRDLLSATDHQPQVRVERGWYY